MPKAVRRPNVRSTAAISRRILVTKSEDSKNAAHYDDVRHSVQRGFDALRVSLEELASFGIGVADLRPQLDSRTLAISTPENALKALASDGGAVTEVRLSIHLEPFDDDVSEDILLDLHISHLIGVCARERAIPSWECAKNGGLIATVTVDTDDIARLVHDVLLDIAMARASHAPWAGIRDTLTSRQLAAKKVAFARHEDLLNGFSYGPLTGDRYIPLTSLFMRTDGQMGLHRESLRDYAALWERFGAFCIESAAAEVALSPAAATALAQQMIKAHKHGGQISVRQLACSLGRLGEGAYRLYFCVHKGQTSVAKARLGALFHKNPIHTRTQMWIIHKEGTRDAEAKYLIERSYVVFYPFVIGGFQ